MKILFRERQAQRTFNDHSILEVRYGSELATKIATRLAVLDVAPNLSVVPRRPPIGLRPVDGATGQFTVDLAGSRRLRFIGLDRSGTNPTADPAEIEEIEVIGVD